MKVLGFLAATAFVLGFGYGWIMNIVSLAHAETIFTGMCALRIIGIFVAPLGAVLGYC